jgi:hypothetical protein
MKYIVIEDQNKSEKNKCHDTKLSFSGADFETDDPEIPEKIRQMMQLYEYGDGSFAQEKKNFLRQGEFMKDYEDNYQDWFLTCSLSQPTYHNLSVNQLRQYFTWRAAVRKGDTMFSTNQAYLHLYLSELLCGIGVNSPEEALKKMQDLDGALRYGYGANKIKEYLPYWIFEYSVIHSMPLDIIMQCANPFMYYIAQDTYIATLKNPVSKKDDEIFLALSFFAEKGLFSTPVVSEGGSRGKHLFAELWKYVSVRYNEEDTDFFTECFGQPKIYKWYPLFYSMFSDICNDSDKECVLNECRKFFCFDGIWYAEYYREAPINKEKFNALLHEAERVFRKYLKVGRALRQKPDETWATQYAEAAIAADKKAEIEAKRPKINIDLSGLDKIRSDAAITRESLLTEEETEEEIKTDSTSENNENSLLDAVHTEILRTLLKNGSADEYIKAAHLMPSVVADTINAALFDEIGDNILECDGKTLKIVEDYVEEVINMLEK